jgi:AP endonuclease-1
MMSTFPKSRGHIGLPAFRHILADPRLQNIPIVLETPSFESTEIWTKEVQILNQLSVMDNKDEDQTAMAAMRTEIENLVRSVVGDANVTSKSRMKKVGSSTSLGKRARDKAGEE